MILPDMIRAERPQGAPPNLFPVTHSVADLVPPYFTPSVAIAQKRIQGGMKRA